MAGKVIFYEGNGASQNIVKTVFTADGFDGKFSPNDEARSAKLYSVPAGYLIAVYDSPDGNYSDDVCEIHVKKETPSSGYVVNTFEKDVEDEYVEQVYEKDNGLDGKVSYLRMRQATEADKQRIKQRLANHQQKK